MRDAKRGVVLPFRLGAAKAEERIREMAKTSSNVILGTHAKERCLERDFVKDDVLRILRTGMVKHEPELTKQKEWKCKVIGRIRGSRDVGVITIILHDGRLFIKTVEWEDWAHG